MSSMGMAGAVAPALLKSRSRRPNASLILAKSARTERGSPTSVGTGSIVPPEGSPDAAVRSSSAARRPASATEYPAACKARLTARPMPLPAPVTSAILPVFAIFVSIVRQPARAASWLHAPRHPLRAQPDPLGGYHQVRHVPADALGGREPARGADDGGGGRIRQGGAPELLGDVVRAVQRRNARVGRPGKAVRRSGRRFHRRSGSAP